LAAAGEGVWGGGGRAAWTHLHRKPNNLKLDLSPTRQRDSERNYRDDEEDFAVDFFEAEGGGDEEDWDGGEGLRVREEGERGGGLGVRFSAAVINPELDFAENNDGRNTGREEETHLDHLDERNRQSEVDVVGQDELRDQR
jgi:hypothetical protein